MTQKTLFSLLCLLGLLFFVGSAQTTVSTIWISPSNTSLSLAEEFNTARGEWTAEQHTGAGGRGESPILHMDSKGLLWIFSGNNNRRPARAMWNYNPLTDEYRWVAGTNDTSAPLENLGEMGVSSPDVYPQPSFYAASAIDNSDNIWIYGGDDDGGASNKLFVFNTTSLEFAWIGGDDSNTVYQTGTQGEPSADVWPGVLMGSCMKADSKGNLWLFGGDENGKSTDRVWHFNTTSRWWTFISGSDTVPIGIDYSDPQWNGRFEAACTIDTNDRVWIFGGLGYTSEQLDEKNNWNDLWSYDTRSMTWTLEFGNASSYASIGSIVSLDQYAANNYPSAREGGRMIDRRDGTLMMYAGWGYTASTYSVLEDIWVFNKTNKMWKIVAGNSSAVNTPPSYQNYRVGPASIGARTYFGAATDLTNRGHFFIFGGQVEGVCCFADIWLIKQDECAVGLHNCDTNAQCTNAQFFGFTCSCKSGYSGDGVTCDDVNECLDGTDNCGADEECVNTSGSFTCQPVTGPQSSAPQTVTTPQPGTGPQSAPKSTVSSGTMILQSIVAIVFVALVSTC